MTPDLVVRLITLIEDKINSEKSSAIPIHIQVLLTLRFLAEGSLQKGCGQDFQHPVSQATVSRCISRVTRAINTLSDKFINFPRTEEQREHVQTRYHAIFIMNKNM